MGKVKVFAGILLLSAAFGREIEWQNRTFELKVPRKSVVAIEFPCNVKGVFTNDLVQADYNKNTVFISIGYASTSVGVSCEKEGIYRGYSFYFFPAAGGDVFFKVRDPQIEKLVVSKQKELDTSKEELLTLSRYVLQSLLKGELPQGFYEIDFQDTYKVGDFTVVVEKAVVGRDLTAKIIKVRPEGYIQKKLTEDILFEKGTVLVWLEKTGYIKSGEEVQGIIIQTRGQAKETSPSQMQVIPFK
jgi:sporulation protein YlmC with PRC-barrel domain